MWPFRRKDAQANSLSKAVLQLITDHIATVPSMDLTGSFQRSSDERFTLIWSDADPSGMTGGFRESGRGRYALIEGNSILAAGSLERPNDGQVSNEGTFALADWLFGEGLKSEFHVFARDGKSLIRHRFEANLFSTGIAQDGRYAICQLCNSDSVDGGTLALFDVQSQSLRWQISPPTGWPDTYRFDRPRGQILLGYRERGEFAYSMDGEFLDHDLWERAQITKGSGFEVLEIVRHRLDSAVRPLSPEVLTELLALIDVAVKRIEYPKDKASAQRVAGEVLEEGGDLPGAVRRYEAALGIDPNCGVKRRLAKLRKQLKP